MRKLRKRKIVDRYFHFVFRIIVIGESGRQRRCILDLCVSKLFKIAVDIIYMFYN